MGVLSIRPMTGYAVREAIRDVLGHFWNESFGQLYPTLASLHADGFVQRRDGDRPGSSTYALTQAGHERLVRLLQRPDVPVPPRNGVMLRLFFGKALGPDACRTLIEQARAHAEHQLSTFQAIRAELATEDEYAAHRPYWLLTVAAGEHTARAALAWAEESLDALNDVDALSDVGTRNDVGPKPGRGLSPPGPEPAGA